MAWQYCEVLSKIKSLNRKKPNFKALRTKMIKEEVPGIKLDYILRDREKGETEEPIYLYNLEQYPLKKYPLSKFEVLNQITRIDVRFGI